MTTRTLWRGRGVGVWGLRILGLGVRFSGVAPKLGSGSGSRDLIAGLGCAFSEDNGEKRQRDLHIFCVLPQFGAACRVPRWPVPFFDGRLLATGPLRNRTGKAELLPSSSWRPASSSL